MQIVNASVELINPPDYQTVLNTIELAGRTCYKSEAKMEYGSAERLIHSMIERGHESVIEHFSITVRFICDRGVSHEIVRHRIAAYSQESTRYCNYSKGKFGEQITVIEPCYLSPGSHSYLTWEQACKDAEKAYFQLLKAGCTPQEARAVLPNSLKTEVVMTADLREWRHFIRLRTSPAAHPQMREVAEKLCWLLTEKYPIFFEDL